MIDWGLSAAITCVVLFIMQGLTDSKVKKLAARVSELERNKNEENNDDGRNDGNDSNA